MNTKQKLLSFFLAIIMLMTLLPLTAFADGETIIKKAVGARQLPRAERKKE